jgi:DNA polymerase I-like protein with 3'-5' exonuclease and polymerase domains
VNNKLISIDFETYLISEEAPIPKPVCVSFYDGEKSGLYVGDEMHEFLLKILTEDYTIIAHNAKFEMLVITTYNPEWLELVRSKYNSGKIVCTQVYNMTLDCIREKPHYRHSLADLVEKYFDIDIKETKKNPDAWRLRYNELDGVPIEKWPKAAIDYAIDDSIYAYNIYKEQQKEKILDIRDAIEADYYLNLMGNIGITVNQETVAKLKQEVQTIIKPALDRLTKAGICYLNDKGTFSKRSLNFRKLIESKVKNLEYTSKGSISINTESLDKYILEDPEFQEAVDFRAIMALEKVQTTYIKALEQADPVIRSSYKPVVSTNRTSSFSSRLYPSVNIQQMPRQVDGTTVDVRNCFEPRPGNRIISIDYGGLELCSCASQLKNFYGSSKMLDLINEGKDLHSFFAAKVLKIPYKEFISKKKELAHVRQLCKAINLGFPGGIGLDTMRTLLAKDKINPYFKILRVGTNKKQLYSLIYKLNADGIRDIRLKRLNKRDYAIVKDELVLLRKQMYNIYPELKKFLDTGHRKFLNGESRWVKNDFGEWEEEELYRYDSNGFYRDRCTYSALCNGYLMQTPSAIGAKKMVCNVMKQFPDITPLAFIHDEILYETNSLDNLENICYSMIDSMKEILPDVKITVEASVMDKWSKAGGEEFVYGY